MDRVLKNIVKKFSEVYGSQKFLTVFITARQLSLPWARSTHSTLSPHFPSPLIIILIFFSHLLQGLRCGLFRASQQNPCMHFPSPPCIICSGHLILPDFITLVIFCDEYKSWESTLRNFYNLPVTFYFLCPGMYLSTLFLKTLCLWMHVIKYVYTYFTHFKWNISVVFLWRNSQYYQALFCVEQHIGLS